MVNRVGLSRKHIFDVVQDSVRRLGTYIDVLQIHRLDRATPRAEIMRALNDVVEKGWVRYIGASSMAALEFQSLQSNAEKNGWHKFISMQNYHNLVYREGGVRDDSVLPGLGRGAHPVESCCSRHAHQALGQPGYAAREHG